MGRRRVALWRRAARGCATRCWPTPTSGWRARGGATREARIDAARDAWYRGWVAEAMVAAVAEPAIDSSGAAHAGCCGRRPGGVSRRPSRSRCRSTSAAGRCSRPARGARGRCSCSSSRCSTGFELGPFLGVEHVHTVIECAKLAFADREAFYGDSAPVPLERCSRASYADERRALVGRGGVAASCGPGGGAAAVGAGRRGGGRRRRRADARRHLPPRRRRPLRQPRLAPRRAAAGCRARPRSRARLRLGTRAQMFWLEDGLPASLVPRSAAAHDAVAVAGAARGRHRARVRHARAATSRTSGRSSSSSRTPSSASTCRPRSTRRCSTPTHFPSSFYPREAAAAAGRDRGPRAGGDDRGAARARARRRGRRRLVARAAERGLARARRAAARRREPARDAGLRGRSLSGNAPALE